MSEVRRMLRAFHREQGEELAGEWQLEGLSLAELQELFDVSSDNPMYDSFRVTEAQVGLLRTASGASIDLQRYDYFVDADRV